MSDSRSEDVLNSVEQFSELVQLIYQAPIKRSWKPFLKAYTEQLNSNKALFILKSRSLARASLFEYYYSEPEHEQIFLEYSHKIGDNICYQKSLERLLHKAYLGNEIVSPDELHNHPDYKTIYRPVGSEFNFMLDDFDEDYIEACTTTTCSRCSAKASKSTLVV
ncbi:hypothetical protein KUV56_13735 [Ferrimonas balearica]|uniref:hypothetical protein n=1 Tax=Ferrimonas balearica TaxID=44012 RepID=UPI001C596A96|nr:hypothetical protein [Ferrimonas balearica]MBW3140557.1 hypothetical protein [Ferrimonas balearica]